MLLDSGQALCWYNVLQAAEILLCTASKACCPGTESITPRHRGSYREFFPNGS
jgi:hypothetical protein